MIDHCLTNYDSLPVSKSSTDPLFPSATYNDAMNLDEIAYSVTPIADDEKPVPKPYIHSHWRGPHFRQPSNGRSTTGDGFMVVDLACDSSHARNTPEDSIHGFGAPGLNKLAPGFCDTVADTDGFVPTRGFVPARATNGSSRARASHSNSNGKNNVSNVSGPGFFGPLASINCQ